MGSAKQITKKIVNLMIFTMLDLCDAILCLVYSYLDELFEGIPSRPCYCFRRSDYDGQLSETLSLYSRRRPNLFIKLLNSKRKSQKCNSQIIINNNRWSDCSCRSCLADSSIHNLHLLVLGPPDDDEVKENVIFLHGFMSSSSFWSETVFRNLSEETRKNYRLIAFDLLGFGKSPKPRECDYTIQDHLQMIEKSVILPFGLNSFHLVAHSMGSILAVALAAKYSHALKSITLIAPPYFPCSEEEEASLYTLRKVAPKKLWPPLVFGASVMSWYEHLGRTVCFLICKNHRFWEFLLKLLTRNRELHFLIMDSTKHTHHSAWQTMHNVICGSAKLMEEYLTILRKERVKVSVIQGEEDQVVPLECSYNIKSKVPEADLRIIPNTDHTSVVLSHTKEFTQDLERIWMSCH